MRSAMPSKFFWISSCLPGQTPVSETALCDTGLVVKLTSNYRIQQFAHLNAASLSCLCPFGFLWKPALGEVWSNSHSLQQQQLDLLSDSHNKAIAQYRSNNIKQRRTVHWPALCHSLPSQLGKIFSWDGWLVPDISDLEGLEGFLTELFQDPGSHALSFMTPRRKTFVQSACKSSPPEAR